MDIIYDQLVQDYGAVTFEAFINLLVGGFPRAYFEILTHFVMYRWISQKTRPRSTSCGRSSKVLQLTR